MARNFHSQQIEDRRGAVLIVVALALVALFAVAALSVDAGNLYQERRKTQAAADAAADAAAIELFIKHGAYQGADTDGRARASALALANAHGYGGNLNSSVQVNIPPLSGEYADRSGYVEVVIDSRLSRTFSGIFGASLLNVKGRAVAAGTLIPTTASVLVLDPTRKDAFKLKGSSSSIEVGGDIVVNSNSQKAVSVGKKGQVTAEHLLVTGTVDRKSKGLINAEVHTGLPPTADPWVSLPPPVRHNALETKNFATTADGQTVFKLQPGTYKELKFSSNDAVHMTPGVYYVDGGGVIFKDNSTLSANRVMIYNAGKKGFKMHTRGIINLTPPTSGMYRGVSLYQDRSTKTKVEFKKGTSYNIQGLIYAPNSEVKFKNTDGDLGGADDDKDDDDWDLEDDFAEMEQDGGTADSGTIGASLVARKLVIEKRSHVRILGIGIGAGRPLLGAVE
jgi:Flp pilus assembly protein TadG